MNFKYTLRNLLVVLIFIFNSTASFTGRVLLFFLIINYFFYFFTSFFYDFINVQMLYKLILIITIFLLILDFFFAFRSASTFRFTFWSSFYGRFTFYEILISLKFILFLIINNINLKLLFTNALITLKIKI